MIYSEPGKISQPDQISRLTQRAPPPTPAELLPVRSHHIHYSHAHVLSCPLDRRPFCWTRKCSRPWPNTLKPPLLFRRAPCSRGPGRWTRPGEGPGRDGDVHVDGVSVGPSEHLSTHQQIIPTFSMISVCTTEFCLSLSCQGPVCACTCARALTDTYLFSF